MKRRYFAGLHEVTKATIRRQTRCVIIAPDIENVEAKGWWHSSITHEYGFVAVILGFAVIFCGSPIAHAETTLHVLGQAASMTRSGI
jgi:hypothetical protein